jgi:hypothetical protein
MNNFWTARTFVAFDATLRLSAVQALAGVDQDPAMNAGHLPRGNMKKTTYPGNRQGIPQQ